MSLKIFWSIASILVLFGDLSGCASDHQKLSIEESFAAKLDAHTKLRGEIDDRKSVSGDFDPAGHYLAVSRSGGFKQSIALKRKVDALRKNSIELLLLLDMVPISADKNLSDDRRRLRNYLSELVLRLDLIGEIYMLGGELPLQSERAPAFILVRSDD